MKTILLTFFYCLFVLLIQAQHLEKTIINACGNSYQLIRISVGEPITGNHVQTAASLSQGFLAGGKKGKPVLPPVPVNNSLLLYPNPAGDFLFIKGNLQSVDRLQIINITGALLLDQKISGNTVNIAHLPQGIYIARLFNASNEQVQVYKIIKK